MIEIDNDTEKKLRNELEFYKECLERVKYLNKHLSAIRSNMNSPPYFGEEFYGGMNRLKMAIVREIGRRRKNMDLLLIKSRFPGDR